MNFRTMFIIVYCLAGGGVAVFLTTCDARQANLVFEIGVIALISVPVAVMLFTVSSKDPLLKSQNTNRECNDEAQ